MDLELIREEKILIGSKEYIIKVEFNGDNYIASGYIDGNLINQTQQNLPDNTEKLESHSPQIENLIYLIKEDFKENEL